MLSPETLTPPLQVLTLNLFYEATEHCSLPPYSGTTMRGALGHALRHRTCLTGAPECKGCQVAPTCVFGTVWEGAWPNVPARSNMSALPTTYVVDAPWQHRAHDLQPGQSFRMTLRLIGPAMEHLRDFILSAANAPVRPLGRAHGNHSVLQLVRAAVVDPDTDDVVIVFDVAQGARIPEALPITELPLIPPADAPTDVRLLLTSPLKVRAKKEVLPYFDPGAFTSTLLDRIEHLYALQHKEHWPYEWQFYRMVAADAQVVSQQIEKVWFERDSRRMPHSIEMKGIVGEVIVRNVHPSLLALWKYAEYIHGGKEAAFGFGHIQLLEAREGVHF